MKHNNLNLQLNLLHQTRSYSDIPKKKWIPAETLEEKIYREGSGIIPWDLDDTFKNGSPPHIFKKYNNRKNRFKIIVNLEDFLNHEYLSELLRKEFDDRPHIQYFSGFLKVRFNHNSFKMAGNAFHKNASIFNKGGFYLQGNTKLDGGNYSSYTSLPSSLLAKLNILLDNHGLSKEHISYIQIGINILNKVFKTRYRVGKKNKVEISKYLSDNFNLRQILPVGLSWELYNMHNAVNRELNEDLTKITNIKFTYKGVAYELKDRLKDPPLNYILPNLVNFSFHVININNIGCLVAYCIISPNLIHKYRFDFDGNLQEKVVDLLMHDGNVSRKVNDKRTLILKGDRVIKIENDV